MLSRLTCGATILLPITVVSSRLLKNENDEKLDKRKIACHCSNTKETFSPEAQRRNIRVTSPNFEYINVNCIKFRVQINDSAN